MGTVRSAERAQRAEEDSKPLVEQKGSALFWGPWDDPERASDDEGNPNADLAALQALDEESTPDEKAEALREQGNDALTARSDPASARTAVQSYTNALAVSGCSDSHCISAFINRSKAHFRLRNLRSSLNDACSALTLDPTNAKAAFRACKACILLGRLDEVFTHTASGLQSQPWNQELKKLREHAEALIEQRSHREQREAERKAETTAYAQQVAAALHWRSISVSRPVFDSHGDPRPWIDEDGILHWRLLVLYPEVGQSDILQDASEEATVGAILDTLLEQPPIWDCCNAYARESVELAYQKRLANPLEHDTLVHWLAGRGAPMEDEASPSERAQAHSRNNIAKAPEDKALWQLLSENRTVVPGHPVFYALSRRSNFRDRVWSGEEDIG